MSLWMPLLLTVIATPVVVRVSRVIVLLVFAVVDCRTVAATARADKSVVVVA